MILAILVFELLILYTAFRGIIPAMNLPVYPIPNEFMHNLYGGISSWS